ncbi:Non-heme dioxygenase N-terminal domain [Macleaya cordata]|uniref:Non-heme dioxygenase N-terminal domain n=1 Tax=Macleaya cordata TaxID=56857 RepID=A0A200PWY3_MACCD|nr:Non-heme dioxygenase N-terminal domain [Macleaya cordata]
MASSAHNLQTLPTLHGVTAAPPPTPATQPNRLSTSDAADALSRLLHRLPPTLSLPTRLSPPTTSPPSVSFSQDNPNFLKDITSSSSQLGFFQLTNHHLPSQLAVSAEIESLSLLNLPPDQKQETFSKIWPLSFEYDHEDGNGDGDAESFCFDSSCSTESTSQSLSSLKEFALALEKVGLEVVEALSCAVGFENPLREGGNKFCSLMWISEGVAGNKPGFSGRFYPYIIALHYQIRCRKYLLLADSGWVSVSPQVDSVLVTVGDIAQVWSNGKLKKVRGRPMAVSVDGESTRCISMSLLLTLPTESTVSTLLPGTTTTTSSSSTDDHGQDNNVKDYNNDDDDDEKEAEDNKKNKLFSSFSFEDYAWRVYHERLPFKDPLDRFRIISKFI